jgi:hypothetical protein
MEPLIRNIQQRLRITCHAPHDHEAQTRVLQSSLRAGTTHCSLLPHVGPARELAKPKNVQSTSAAHFRPTDIPKHNTTEEKCNSQSTPTGRRLSTGTQSSDRSTADSSSSFTRRQSMGRQHTHRLPSYRLPSLRLPSYRRATISWSPISWSLISWSTSSP